MDTRSKIGYGRSSNCSKRLPRRRPPSLNNGYGRLAVDGEMIKLKIEAAVGMHANCAQRSIAFWFRIHADLRHERTRAVQQRL